MLEEGVQLRELHGEVLSDYLVNKRVPVILRASFRGQLGKLVECNVSHDFLVKVAVLRFGVEDIILPTLLVLAGDRLPRFKILTEIESLPRS